VFDYYKSASSCDPSLLGVNYFFFAGNNKQALIIKVELTNGIISLANRFVLTFQDSRKWRLTVGLCDTVN